MPKVLIDAGTLNRLNLASSVLGVTVPVPGLTVVGVVVADASGTYRYDAVPTGYTEELLEATEKPKPAANEDEAFRMEGPTNG